MLKFIIFIILNSSLLCLAQQFNIDSIAKQADLIELNQNLYERKVDEDIQVQKDLNGKSYSFESKSLKGIAMINLKRFYENGKIRKAVVKFDCEQIDLYSSYYYLNDTLIFVAKKRIEYNLPKWSEAFDEKENKKEIERFYFHNRNLIKWFVDYQDKTEKPSLELEEKQLINDAYLYKNY